MSTEPRLATRAVRAAIATDTSHGAVVPPIHLSANFAFDGFGKPRPFDYTRSGNPTRSQLADALAQLEGGASAVVTNTGMSAVTLLLHRLKPGDTIVAAHDCYGGTQRLLRSLAARGLFSVVFADLTSAAGVATIAAERPVMVWIETPSNPLLRITDIARVSAEAKRVGALAVVDNTFLSPVLQRPLELGADVVLHSTTKYLNGHSDVVGGAVIAADAALAADLTWWANCLGVTGAPFDAYLTLRGLRTLFARMDHHLANTNAVVVLLCEHPAVERVYYPGIESHPGHELARRQQSGFGAMVSFELHGGVPSVERFLGELRTFTLAESLGGVESLVAHPATMTHASMDAQARTVAGIGDGLVRLSVGIESSRDLVDDLERALSCVAPARRAATEASATNALVSARSADDRPGVLLIGAGKIGCELLAQIDRKGSGVPFRVCGVADRSGFAFERDGLSNGRLGEILARKHAGGHVVEVQDGRPGAASELVALAHSHRAHRPIVVDLTAADTRDVLREAIVLGCDAVLANKVPLAGSQAGYDELLETAHRHGGRLLHEATVGAGLPVLHTLRKLLDSGDEIVAIEGCPSGTLGFLFGELGNGRPFSAALQDAVAQGLTEPDPRIDLSGVDVGRKALILGRLIGFRGDPDDIAIESLLPDALAAVPVAELPGRLHEVDDAWSRRVLDAAAAGCVLRYRVRVTPASIAVGLVRVPHGSPLASLSGTDNQFAFTTARYNRQPLVITGPGAGPAVTAGGVFNDIAELATSPRARRPVRHLVTA